MSWIASQTIDAADPAHSAWVSANAGAGKTYTLANRVTRLLLEGNKPERILCLTYTKAAAAEMAGRLFAQLGEWAMLDDIALGKRMVAIGAPGRNREGLREARRLFALALETPGGLKIQTIHAFCQYVLARFPLEAGIQPSFRVLDDQTARELRDNARSRIFDRAGMGDSELSAAIALLVTESDEGKVHAIIDQALSTDRRKFERFLATLPEDEKAIATHVQHLHGLQPGETAEKTAASFCAEMKREEARLRELLPWLAAGTITDRQLAQSLRAAIESANFTSFAEIFLTKAGTPRKRLATRDRIADNSQLYFYLEEVASRLVAAEQHCRTAQAAALAEAGLALAIAAHREYAAEKQARGVLDYDDLIVETLRLLSSREAAAWVLYKLDGGIDHILIDEGQDTSPEQWRIVKHLAEEFFAGSGSRDERSRRRTIFVVGDEKQSIFSFQGADPTQFDINRQYFSERAADAADRFVTAQLSTSRRSAPEILQFVDEVFADPSAREGVTSQAQPIAHEAHRVHAKGRVEFWPMVKPLDRPKIEFWLQPVDVVRPDDPARRLAAQIAERIEGWTDGKTRLPGHEEAIQPGDIMVLMPRREPFASELIRQLKRRAIPVAGADRIRLSNQIAVMDLIALGRFALLPEDDLNLAALLRSPFVSLSEENLMQLAATRTGTLWQELSTRREQDAALNHAYGFLSGILSRADFAPPYEFFTQVLGAGKMRSRLLKRLGAEANDAIDEFLSLALVYESLNPPSLEGFLHWLERGGTEIKRDMERGRNEVRVMTVHGAKGLEADIVILPDTNSLPPSRAHHGALMFADDMAYFPLPTSRAPAAIEAAKAKAEDEALREHRRLFYVALTRARDQLHIFGFEGRNGVKDQSWYRLAERAAHEIGSPEMRDGQTVHIVGSAQAERGAASGAEICRVEHPVWLDNAPPAEPPGARSIRPSRTANLEQPATFSPVGAERALRFRRGNLVHALLARLPEVPGGRRREIALAFLAKRDIEGEIAEQLVAETLAVLDDPLVAPAFGPHSRAEVAIIAALPEIGPDVHVNGRIDRLAVGSQEILAVDFKTNRPSPSRVEDVAPVYLTQMALYRAALTKIFPARQIACALVWTDGPTLMLLPPDILDTETARLRASFEPS